MGSVTIATTIESTLLRWWQTLFIVGFLCVPWILSLAACAPLANATGVVPLTKREAPIGSAVPQSTFPAAALSPSPESCGAWASASGVVGVMITARYGEIRQCQIIGAQIVITTLGSSKEGLPGVIAIYQCKAQDTTCQNGQTRPPAKGWQFFLPPNHGGVTVLIQSSLSVLIIDNAGAQMCFSLMTHTYDRNPVCH